MEAAHQVSISIFTLLLCAWFILSVINQFFKGLLTKWKFPDPLGLIPNWTFFAPEPGTSDFRIIVQAKRNGEPAPTQEIKIYGNSYFRPIFNPAKLVQKSFFDIAQSHLMSVSKYGAEHSGLMLLPSYVSLLELARRQLSSNEQITDYRFIIIDCKRSKIDRENRPLYASRWHVYG